MEDTETLVGLEVSNVRVEMFQPTIRYGEGWTSKSRLRLDYGLVTFGRNLGYACGGVERHHPKLIFNKRS